MTRDEAEAFMREQLRAFDALPPAVRRAIAEAPHPVDAVGVLGSVPRSRLSRERRERLLLEEVERRVGYMSDHVARMYEELREA